MDKEILSERIRKLIEEGTVREKAVVICHDYVDCLNTDQDTVITRAERDAIMRSLTDKEADEVNRYLKLYDVYVTMAHTFGLVEAAYMAVLRELTGYLRQIEAYNQEQDHINSLFKGLVERGYSDAAVVLTAQASGLRFRDAEAGLDADGYMVIDVADLWDKVTGKIDFLRLNFSIFKDVIVAVEEFTRKRRCKDFMPEIMVKSLKNARRDYAAEINPKYSHKELLKRIAKGENVTDEEMALAVFPSYEEIPTTAKYVQRWRDEIKSAER